MNIRNKIRRIGAVILAVLFAVLPISDQFVSVEVQAETVEIRCDGYAKFGGRSCGKYFVNGEVAFCMEHIKDSPESGTVGEANPYSSDLIKTILYYGWGGPGNLYENEDEGIVRTSFALNYVYAGDPALTNDDRISGIVLAQPLLDYAQEHLITDMNISFEKSSVEGKPVPDGYLQTEEIHIQGDPRNTITFQVPESVRMHNLTTGVTGNGQVTVKGQDTIFFTSNAEDHEEFNTGELVGSMGHYQPILIKSGDSGKQDLGKLAQMDDLHRTSLNVTWPEVPEIRTKAFDIATGVNQGHPMKQVTIKDTISYEHLIPGTEYTLRGTLKEKTTGESLKLNGNDITAEKTFTAAEGNGTIDLEFSLEGLELAGKAIVVFEKLYQGTQEVAAHEDLQDSNQTVFYPGVQVITSAGDTETEIHEAFPNENTVLRDIISYTNLIPENKYTVKGTLMDKSTGKPLKINGTAVTAEKTFRAKAANGSEEIEFYLDSRNLAGKDLVVFEKLYFGGQEIAAHEDLQDAGQTITMKKVEIRTSAKDTESLTNAAYVSEHAVLEDEITYTNLIAGKEYTIKGLLMDKQTGEPLKKNGNAITAEKTFTADQENGVVKVEFAFDGNELKGKELVVFEHLLYKGREIAVHADLSDEGQTISFCNPELKTTAADKRTGTHNVKVADSVTITDKVTYSGLIPGKEYVIRGVLRNKDTGKPLLVNGKQVEAEKLFHAEEETGSVELEFTFDASALSGRSVVVFEKLFYEGREIAAHEELEDKNQTVTFLKEREILKVDAPKTGDRTRLGVFTFLMSGFLGISFVLISAKKAGKRKSVYAKWQEQRERTP